MATKKAAEKTAPLPAPKMTKTQIVKALAEKLEAEPKQIQSFLDALAEMATEQTHEAGEFTVPELGKLVKGNARNVWAAIRRPAKRSRSLPRRP